MIWPPGAKPVPGVGAAKNGFAPLNQAETCPLVRVARHRDECYFEEDFRVRRIRKPGGDFESFHAWTEARVPSLADRRVRTSTLRKNCASGRRSALRSKLARAQGSRVVLVSQR